MINVYFTGLCWLDLFLLVLFANIFYLIKSLLGFALIFPLYISLQPFSLVSLLTTVGFLHSCHSLFEPCHSFDINRCLRRAPIERCDLLESITFFSDEIKLFLFCQDPEKKSPAVGGHWESALGPTVLCLWPTPTLVCLRSTPPQVSQAVMKHCPLLSGSFWVFSVCRWGHQVGVGRSGGRRQKTVLHQWPSGDSGWEEGVFHFLQQ